MDSTVYSRISELEVNFAIYSCFIHYTAAAKDCVGVRCDNQSAIHLAKNQKIGTNDNAADMLTKTVSLLKFKQLKLDW
ncbi:unnamed protein product [Prunus armeniaca]